MKGRNFLFFWAQKYFSGQIHRIWSNSIIPIFVFERAVGNWKLHKTCSTKVKNSKNRPFSLYQHGVQGGLAIKGISSVSPDLWSGGSFCSSHLGHSNGILENNWEVFLHFDFPSRTVKYDRVVPKSILWSSADWFSTSVVSWKKLMLTWRWRD